MNGGDAASSDPVARVHESGDGKPAIDSGGAGDMRAGRVGLEIADEEIELHAEKNVERDEEALHDETDSLRTIYGDAADLVLFG